MTDISGFNRFNHFICHGQNSTVTKTCCHFMTAIDTCKMLVFCITAKFQCFFNNRCKIFLIINMHDFRIRHHLCCKYSICIAGLRRHQTVGCKENRCRHICKFFLLILPCCTKVAFEMRIFFQFRIRMGRKHFTMGVNIDAFILCLLQKPFEII